MTTGKGTRPGYVPAFSDTAENTPKAPQRQTSITAHVVRMGCVTMAFTDLDVVDSLLRKVQRECGDELTVTENAVIDEFGMSVESIR